MEIGSMLLNCHCGYPSRRWTATTRRNYGWRFLGCCIGKVCMNRICVKALCEIEKVFVSTNLVHLMQQMGHCEFFVWLDPPISSPMTQVRESELVLAQERERKLWTVVILCWMMADRANTSVNCLQAKITNLESEMKSRRARDKWLWAVIILFCSYFLYNVMM